MLTALIFAGGLLLPERYSKPLPLPAFLDTMDLKVEPEFVNKRPTTAVDLQVYAPVISCQAPPVAIEGEEAMGLNSVFPGVIQGTRVPGSKGSRFYEFTEVTSKGVTYRDVRLNASNSILSCFTRFKDGSNLEGAFRSINGDLRMLYGPPNRVFRIEKPSKTRPTRSSLPSGSLLQLAVADEPNCLIQVWAWGSGKVSDQSLDGWYTYQKSTKDFISGLTTIFVMTYNSAFKYADGPNGEGSTPGHPGITLYALRIY